jgi:hypothetical protein
MAIISPSTVVSTSKVYNCCCLWVWWVVTFKNALYHRPFIPHMCRFHANLLNISILYKQYYIHIIYDLLVTFLIYYLFNNLFMCKTFG